MAEALSRSSYLSRNVGDFPAEMEINGRRYVKIDDLRYGTNPHQPAAFYRPVEDQGAIMDMETLKNGKSGLSQTNLEDISYALNIVKFFDRSACAVMKHVNPSGAAVAVEGDDLKTVYLKARDADARAAFGSVIAFNTEVDCDTAREIKPLALLEPLEHLESLCPLPAPPNAPGGLPPPPCNVGTTAIHSKHRRATWAMLKRNVGDVEKEDGRLSGLKVAHLKNGSSRRISGITAL